LSIPARKQVQGIATHLLHPRNEGRVVVVEGYSDSNGSAERNFEISLERAKAVARELVFNGLSRDRIRVEAYGEERPTQPNTDELGKPDTKGQAANRRVEVYLAK
jgi:outer membrane protein OmpA-like peptidoglycan-associated protein